VTTAVALPAGTWVLDPARAVVQFSGRVSRLAPTFRAGFGAVAGVVDVAGFAQLSVQVDVASVTTGNPAWDELLRTLDPFDASRCPVASYRGRADLSVGDRAHVSGELELRGVSRPLTLLAELAPSGDEVLVRATGTVDRHAFGVRFDLPGVGRFVPSQLQLDIEVTAVRAPSIPKPR
jgi:polyisoprenoid-binding protein YceI